MGLFEEHFSWPLFSVYREILQGTSCKGQLAGDILQGTTCKGHLARDNLQGTTCK